MATVDHRTMRTQPHVTTVAIHCCEGDIGDGDRSVLNHGTATIVCACGITISGPRSEVQRLADEHSRGV